MTDTLERLTSEVRKLTPSEVAELRAWIIDFQPDSDRGGISRRVDWSGHAARVREIFNQDAPARENTVLTLRQEERT